MGRLNESSPEPSIKASEEAAVLGGKIFPSFPKYVKNSDEAQEEALLAALIGDLEAINTFLQTNGPYLGGSSMNEADCSLLPRLQHMVVAGKAIKGFVVPEKLTALHKYMQEGFASPVFTAQKPADEAIVSGWKSH